MQGNFEKRVQEKLDELRLTPSEPVWKAVEKEIGPEKRRRFPFWIPFIIVMLGGATWWLLGRGEEEREPVVTVVSTSPKATNEVTTRTVSPSPIPTGEQQTPQTITTASPTEKNAAVNSVQPRKQVNGFEQPVTVQATQASETSDQKIITKNRERSSSSDKTVSAKTTEENSTTYSSATNKVTSERASIETEKGLLKTTGTPADTAQTISTEFTTTSTSTPVDTVMKKSETSADLPQVKKDTTAAKTKLAASKKGWQKMVTVNVGLSQYADGELGQNQRADLNSAPSSGYNNGMMGNPGPVKRGAAFQVGFGLQKIIHPRWELTIGLQYGHYTTHAKVGEYKAIDTAILVPNGDVALRGYYKNTNQQDFTIRYGILEMPVSIGFRPLARLPLTLSAGATYGRVLHANALQFDRWANIYYTDKEATKKAQFAGFASLQYAVLNKAAWRLDAGPLVQYHFSTLHENSNDKRLFFAGLKTLVTF